jgi:hypothetical protein
MRRVSWLTAKPVSFSRRILLHGVSKLCVVCAGRRWLTMHLAYGAARGNSGESRRIYLWQYPKRNLLHHTAFVSVGHWLRETATLPIRKPNSGRRRPVRTAYVELHVLDRVWKNHDPVAAVVLPVTWVWTMRLCGKCFCSARRRRSEWVWAMFCSGWNSRGGSCVAAMNNRASIHSAVDRRGNDRDIHRLYGPWIFITVFANHRHWLSRTPYIIFLWNDPTDYV